MCDQFSNDSSFSSGRRCGSAKRTARQSGPRTRGCNDEIGSLLVADVENWYQCSELSNVDVVEDRGCTDMSRKKRFRLPRRSSWTDLVSSEGSIAVDKVSMQSVSYELSNTSSSQHPDVGLTREIVTCGLFQTTDHCRSDPGLLSVSTWTNNKRRARTDDIDTVRRARSSSEVRHPKRKRFITHQDSVVRKVSKSRISKSTLPVGPEIRRSVDREESCQAEVLELGTLIHRNENYRCLLGSAADDFDVVRVANRRLSENRTSSSFGTSGVRVTENAVPSHRVRFAATQRSDFDVDSDDDDDDDDAERRRRVGEMYRWVRHDTSRCQVYASFWMCTALGALVLSNLFFFAAFVTNSWGIMTVWPPPIAVTPTPPEAGFAAGGVDGRSSPMPDRVAMSTAVPVPRPRLDVRYWYFGLWQCCRHDGLCLGTRWPKFYSATRTLCVLALFGHALSFAWLLGHTLEKLLEFDVCTMAAIIALSFATSVFVLLAIVCFGCEWPKHFEAQFPNSTTAFGYSFYFAMLAIPLTLVSGVCAIIDLKGSWKDLEVQVQFNTPDGRLWGEEPSTQELVRFVENNTVV